MFKSLLTTCALLGLATAPAIAQDTKTIRFGFSSVKDLENDNGAAAILFEQYVETHSDTLEVEIYGSSEIGDDQDVIQALQLGSGATMHIGGTATYNTFVPRAGVLDLPFLWTDYAHAGRALDGDAGAELAADFEQAGFKVLGYGFSWGYRNVVTNGVAVTEPEDLKGLKLRTIQSPIYVAALNAMGANATPMGFDEVYTALQTKVLDGFEHAASMVYSSKLYEVTDHVALTRHLFGPTVMTYSLPLWNQLAEEERQVVQDAADFALEIARAMAPGREQEALDKLVEEGMTITEVDTSPFMEAAQPLQDELAGTIDASDLLEQIRAAAEQ
ncbi:TRAP transporter substrate-binding protein [Chelativorans sp. AA-79]|uniref:TRAP transporter substrate-binding protein n=1 Tax=Chelativorans sp. AA-79 TaxID=3028735 RepID=UPI0023F79B23|nr:TRAP transporter substrate-binding protein [Chelativorans sp. AA-79]WEX10913.1 TRAP transporter substrate-binding protein [Chelativorans sp. AA-79]